MRGTFALAVAILCIGPAIQAQQAERITGTVTGDSEIPLVGAEVIVTRGPDRAVQRDTTGPDGRFSIVWREGTGDYLVYISAFGREPFRKRVQRTSESDSVFVVDAALAPLAIQLSPVAVVAPRPRPRRGSDPAPPSPVREWTVGDNHPLLGPEEGGDLDAMLATVPGMVRGPDGRSALGLDPAQNQTTLDGLGFSAGNIPRDAGVRARVSTSPYDPTRGGFSGAQTSLDFWLGGLFTRSRASASLDAPVLQVSDVAAGHLGPPFTNVRISMGADGPFGGTDAYRYNVSADVSRRTSDAVSLFNAPPAALRVAGVSPDSAALLAAILEQLDIPSGPRLPARRTTEQITVLARGDRTGFNWNAGEDLPRSGAITAYARLRRSAATGLGPTVAATQAGRSGSETLALQALYSVFAGEHRDRLIELRSSYSIERYRAEPALLFPSGQVLVSAGESEDATAAVTTLRFGGSPLVSVDGDRWTWETIADGQWYASRTHGFKFRAQSRLDGLNSHVATNTLGTFTFNSLADLAAGKPASFSRTLGTARGSGTVWNGALAVGDFWRPHQRLQIVYGVRLEGSTFLTQPDANPDIARIFETRTDFVPSRLHVSPRIGFTWRYTRRSDLLPAGPLSAAGLGMVLPAGVLRGGVGEFRSLFFPELLAGAVPMTGLPGGITRLLCVGEGVPEPVWEGGSDAQALIPASCATSNTNAAETGQPVTVIDRRFDVPRSWRGNLSWTTRWRRIGVNVDGVISLNRNQPGTLDLNLVTDPTEVLASEGNRPLFVPAASIVPATGALVPSLARRDAAYARVASLRSDLRSESRQLVIRLQPLFTTPSQLSLAYALGSVRSEQRGSDGAAFGDLHARERARGDFDVRHQFVFGGSRAIGWLGGTRFTLFGIVQSGYPYTPLVAGDVNGDGLSNDRAFVHAPSTASAAGDTALATAMQSLLGSAPEGARHCLERQLGSPAARNSCEGPWSATINARVDLPWRFVGMGFADRKRVRVAIHLTNPLAGIDQLLHGSRGLRGWGTAAIPERTLYTVNGFDPATRRFRYEVNPRFGRTDPASSILRTPFRVTLDVSADLGRPFEVQQVDRFLAPGRSRPGTKLDSAALHARYARSVPNVFRPVLRHADSLFLSAIQIETLEREERAYLDELERHWGQLAAEFAELPSRFDAAAALRRQEDFVEQGGEINRRAAFTIRELLTPLQVSLAPEMIKQLLTGSRIPRVIH